MRTIERLQPTLLIILVGLVTCPATVQAQIEWTPYSGNPVLAPGAEGDWDSGVVLSPTVIKSGDSLKMWYAGSVIPTPPSNYAIGYATSTDDGITWTKHSANPVMTGRPGEWDGLGAHSPIVMLDGDTLRMWYVGGNSPDQANIGYATSVDGVSWDQHPTPVMRLGAADTWNMYSMGPGTVIKEDGVFKMWFFGGVGGILGAGANMKFGIGYATSPDGVNWTLYDDPATTAPPYQFSDPVLNHGEAGAWDANAMFTPSVVRTEEGYEMWYSGSQHGGQQYMGYAKSPDGITWTKHSDNPHTWASRFGFPSVILDDGQYRMWYWLDSRTEIGSATSPAGVGTALETVPIQEGFELHQNYPNPFERETSIRYKVPATTHVELNVYNVLGQRVRTLIDRVQPVGTYEVRFDGRSESREAMPNGVYFYKLETQGIGLTGRMMLLR